MIFVLTIFIVLIGTFDPSVHIRFVCPGIILFSHTFFPDLVGENVIELLMLSPGFVLLADVLEASFLILFKALLDVLLLLLHLQFFAVIFHSVTHAIHNGLNATSALCHLMLSGLLFFKLHAHILFNLLSFSSFDCIKFSLSLLLFNHIVLDNLHCSLTLSHLLPFFVLFLFLEICCQFSHSLSFLCLALLLLNNLLLLSFLEHSITLMLLLFDFISKIHLLFSLHFHLLSSSVEKLFIEVLSLFDIFLAQLLTKLDLLIENVSNLFRFLNVLCLLLPDLLFVEFLAEFLNLAPLIVTNV